MRTKIVLSRSVNLSDALSRRWIWSSILRTAKSRRGLSGPGGLTASLSLDWMGVLSSLSPHFLANLSDIEFFLRQLIALDKCIFTHLTCGDYWRIYVGVYAVGVFALFVDFWYAIVLGLGAVFYVFV